MNRKRKGEQITYNSLGKLYQTVYELFKSRLDVCEMTVEDPNEEFSDMRDKNDIRYLLEHKALNGLKAPVSAEKIEELCSTFKLTNRQTQRCIEMYLLSNVNKLNSEEYRQYRLQVKARLYTFNFVSTEIFRSGALFIDLSIRMYFEI